MKSQKEYAKIIAKAWSDPKFKEQFLKHPEAVFKEHGIQFPKGAKIQVHENTDNIVHLVLPQKPAGELSFAELNFIAAAGSGGPCGQVQMHENTDNIVHLVLPQKPARELSFAELNSIAAAASGGPCGGPCSD